MSSPCKKLPMAGSAKHAGTSGMFPSPQRSNSVSVFMMVSCFGSMRSDSNRRLSCNAGKPCTVCATFFVPRDRRKPDTRGTRIASVLSIHLSKPTPLVCARGTRIASSLVYQLKLTREKLSAHVVHGLHRQTCTNSFTYSPKVLSDCLNLSRCPLTFQANL